MASAKSTKDKINQRIRKLASEIELLKRRVESDHSQSPHEFNDAQEEV